MKSKGQNQNKFVKIISTPIRVLGKARDAYVKGITQCGHNMSYSNPVDATGNLTALPRSYSATSAATSRSSSEAEDFAELMRAASARTLGNRIDVDLVLKQQQQEAQAQAQSQAQPVGSNGLPKSVSVGMGRIDEDKPYDFGEGDVPVLADSYPRSRSYAVGKRNVVL